MNNIVQIDLSERTLSLDAKLTNRDQFLVFYKQLNTAGGVLWPASEDPASAPKKRKRAGQGKLKEPKPGSFAYAVREQLRAGKTEEQIAALLKRKPRMIRLMTNRLRAGKLV